MSIFSFNSKLRPNVLDSSLRVLVMLSLTFGTLFTAQEVRAERKLGGIDIDAYCRDYMDGSSASFGLQKFRPNAYSWQCESNTLSLPPGLSFQYKRINLNHACQTQYPVSKPWHKVAYAKTYDPGNPYSWVCVVD
ncbi:MAG: hypothetical protein WBB28_12290 [Crinalium sp.]